jgi:hypothetical protein
MAQGIVDLVDKLHQAGIALVNPSLCSFGIFGDQGIELSCLADIRAVGRHGRFHARPRELHGCWADACPDLVCRGEGGKHTSEAHDAGHRSTGMHV